MNMLCPFLQRQKEPSWVAPETPGDDRKLRHLLSKEGQSLIEAWAVPAALSARVLCG